MRFKVDYKHFLALYILTTWVCAVTCIATTMRLESIVHDKSFRQLSTTRLFTSRPDNVDDKHLQQKPFRRRKSSKTTKPIAVSIATPHLTETRSNNSPMIHWRLSNLEIPLSQDPGKGT